MSFSSSHSFQTVNSVPYVKKWVLSAVRFWNNFSQKGISINHGKYLITTYRQHITVCVEQGVQYHTCLWNNAPEQLSIFLVLLSYALWVMKPDVIHANSWHENSGAPEQLSIFLVLLSYETGSNQCKCLALGPLSEICLWETAGREMWRTWAVWMTVRCSIIQREQSHILSLEWKNLEHVFVCSRFSVIWWLCLELWNWATGIRTCDVISIILKWNLTSLSHIISSSSCAVH